MSIVVGVGAQSSPGSDVRRPARRPSEPGRYRLQSGSGVPGVTGVLSDLGIGALPPMWVSAERRRELAERGQRVHAAAATAWSNVTVRCGQTMTSAAPKDEPFLAAFHSWRSARTPLFASAASIEQELPLVAEDACGLACGGRLDLLVVQIRPVIYIIDYKLRPSAERAGGDGLQLAGYEWLLRRARPELFGRGNKVKRRIISLRDDGAFREIRFEAFAAQDDLTWRGALAAWWERYGRNAEYDTDGKNAHYARRDTRCTRTRNSALRNRWASTEN